jgi:cytochrome c oxidase subunit 2
MTFQIRCAELCGLWHGYMSETGRILGHAGFVSWIAARRTQFEPVMKYLPKYAPSYNPDPTYRAG